jgi:hypothetical protein
MINNKEDDCAACRDQKAAQVEAVYPHMTKYVKEPTTDDRANNAKQYVEYNSLTPVIHDMTRDKT